MLDFVTPDKEGKMEGGEKGIQSCFLEGLDYLGVHYVVGWP